jgi:hypothetical protein
MMRIQKSPGRTFIGNWTSVSEEGKWLDIAFSAFERIMRRESCAWLRQSNLDQQYTGQNGG